MAARYRREPGEVLEQTISGSKRGINAGEVKGPKLGPISVRKLATSLVIGHLDWLVLGRQKVNAYTRWYFSAQTINP